MARAERFIDALENRNALPQAFTYRARDNEIQCTCLPGSARHAKDMILCIKESNILVWSHQPCQVQELTPDPHNISREPSEVWQKTLSELNEISVASKAIVSTDFGDPISPGAGYQQEAANRTALTIFNPADAQENLLHRLKHVSTTFRCDAPCRGSNRLIDWFWCKKCCSWQHRACMLYGEPGDRGGPVCNVCYKHFFDHIHEFRAWQKQRQLEVVRHAWAFLNEADCRDNEWRVAQAWRLALVKAFLWGFIVEHRRQFLLEDKRKVARFEQQCNEPGVLGSVYRRRQLQQRKFGLVDYRERTDEDLKDAPPLGDDLASLPGALEYDCSHLQEDRQHYERAAIPQQMLPNMPLPRNTSLFAPQIATPASRQALVRQPPKRKASVFHADQASQKSAQPRPSKHPKTRHPSPEPESAGLGLCSCNPRPDMTNSLCFTCRRCGQDQHATCAVAMRTAGKPRKQVLFCNDCHPTIPATATNATSGVHATSRSSNAEYVQSMRSEIEALSSTILWKIWWDLPLPYGTLLAPGSMPSQAPSIASQSFMLECTTRLSTLLATAGQDLSNEMLTPALATFPRRPEVVLSALQALIEAVMPNLRPPWSRRPQPRVLTECEKSSFGVLLEIVGLVGKGDLWSYGKGIGWR